MYLLSLIVIVLLSFIFVSNRKTNQILNLILEGTEHDREIIMQTQNSNMTRKEKQIQKAKQRAKQMIQKQQKSS